MTTRFSRSLTVKGTVDFQSIDAFMILLPAPACTARVGRSETQGYSPGFRIGPSGLKDNARLFHDQIILYGCDPFNASCDFPCFINGLLRISEAAQLNGALVGFDTDLE